MTDELTIEQKFNRHIASYDLTMQCKMAGEDDSEIIIIGEYPGTQDVGTDTPFAGGSGKILWNALRKHKIVRPQCYTTFVVKRQVTAKDNVQTQEYTLWQEALQFELNCLKKPKIILCLGNVTLNALLGFDGITHYRGSVYEYKFADGTTCPIVVAASPSSVLKQPETEIIFAMDMEKASRVLTGDFVPHEVTKIINPTFAEAKAMMRAVRKRFKKVSVDIEVTGYETACIGLGISAHTAMCINFRDATKNRYTAAEEFKLLQCFVNMCDQEDTFVITQNGNFDSYFMGFKDHAMFKTDFDTLLAHHTLYPRLPHNLGFLTSQYTDHPYYKDDKSVFKEGGNIDSFWEYNCTDCAITYAVYEKEFKELKDQKLDTFFFDHVMRLQPHLSESTVTGVAVDPTIKERLSREIGADVTKLRNEVITAARYAARDPELEINPNSPKQVTNLLYNTLHLRYHRRSADAKARKDLMNDPRTGVEAKEFLGKLGKYNEEAKFFSTYVETKIDPDNRFRAEFKQYGVSKAPGRLSSGQTLWGSGGNAQNQPHRAYEMYVADEDCVFIYFDLSQAEARYVAWDAWIEPWIADFERARLEGGFDAHRSLAATMFKMPYDEVPTEDWLDGEERSLKDKNCDMTSLHFTKRFIAKKCRHGLNYRMHIARLAETTGMSYAQAASNYYTYHRTTPELQIWWSNVEREIKKTRMLFNAYGRRFITLERLDSGDIMDSIIAFKPQSTIGDKTQKVWYQCHEDERWDKSRGRIALNVHDALYGIATKSFAKTALSIMKKYAEEPIMVRRTKDGVVNPMIVPADMKMSQVDKTGFHRMSNLHGIEIEAAQ